MKKHLLAVTLIITLGLAVGCGSTGASGDVTVTTVEQESELLTGEDMELQETDEMMTFELSEEATDAAAMDTENTSTEAFGEEATDDPQAPTETEVLSTEAAE